MRYSLCVLALAACCVGAEVYVGTWAGERPTIPADATVVLALYDRNATTCCGGPAAALAGLGNLRTALADRAGVQLIAIDVTSGATVAQAQEAAALHRTDGIPLLVDPTRATATALGVKLDMAMTYVVRRPDGAQEVVFSPAQVRRKLDS